MKLYVAFFFVAQSLFIIHASRLQRYDLNYNNVASFDELNKSGTSNETKIVDEHVERISFALTFRFCTGYTGIIQICYDSISPNFDLKGSCAPSQCELYVDIHKQYGIKFTSDSNIARSKLGSVCDDFKIYDTESEFSTVTQVKTCPPRIENGIVHLDVKSADPGCEVEVVVAEIKYPEILTTPLPSTPKPTASDSTSKSSLEWWGIVILVILALIIIGIVATFGFLCWKKRRASKPTEDTKAVTVITDAKELPPPTIQTASKTSRPNLNFTQFEPSKSQKKQ
uniref:Uncharacterized protein n=1 Tax=Panagrolaimus sp. ES5 TaxID=591445 RepID=A0AC34G9X5_9BILA